MGSDKLKKSHKRKYSNDSNDDTSDDSGRRIVLGSCPRQLQLVNASPAVPTGDSNLQTSFTSTRRARSTRRTRSRRYLHALSYMLLLLLASDSL